MGKVNQYKRAQQALDDVSSGFPSMFGIERIGLKKLFTEEEAEFFADMERGYQTPGELAARTGRNEADTAEMLYSMSKKGLIYRRHATSGYEYYRFPFAFGMIEWQVGNPDKSWMPYLGGYAGLSRKFGELMGASMPMYRSVPFHKDMVVDSMVLPYDDIEQVLDSHDRFAVAPCMCRTMNESKKCNHPKETCIVTDEMADFYIENEFGRSITRDEARRILMSGQQDGRIIQITNSKKAENICSCCQCGCMMLTVAGRFTKPAGKKWSNYYCSIVDEDSCTGCGACQAACTWGVVKVKKGFACLPDDMSFCQGCGLCVAACKAGVLKLKMKPKHDIYEPPNTLEEAHDAWHDFKVELVERG